MNEGLWSGLLGAILGALIAGGVTLMVTFAAHREQELTSLYARLVDAVLSAAVDAGYMHVFKFDNAAKMNDEATFRKHWELTWTATASARRIREVRSHLLRVKDNPDRLAAVEPLLDRAVDFRDRVFATRPEVEGEIEGIHKDMDRFLGTLPRHFTNLGQVWGSLSRD